MMYITNYFLYYGVQVSLDYLVLIKLQHIDYTVFHYSTKACLLGKCDNIMITYYLVETKICNKWGNSFHNKRM